MTDIAGVGESRGSRGRVAGAFATFAALAALLCLDGRLGPLSFVLRRDIALAVLAVVVVSALRRRGLGDGVARSGGLSRRAGWRVAGWAAVAAAIVIVARAPSVPVALVGFVIALAAIEIGPGARAAGGGLVTGLVPACLSYVVVRFAVDLVPQAGAIAEATARGGSWWINRARGFNLPLSFTAIGGPAVGLALLYLLWNGRASRMGWRVVAGVVIAAVWFALLPAVTPKVEAGPIAVFSRGAGNGLFWLGTAAVVGAVLGRRPGGDPGEEGGHEEGGQAPGCAVSQSPFSPTAEEARSSAARWGVLASGRLAMGAAGVAAVLAGVCLVGTAFLGPAAGRSVRVLNSGGLDWERPVYGQFGPFSGGMFGLWPVYCRAEGYDFNVIDRSASVVRGPSSVVGPSGKSGASPSAPKSGATSKPGVPSRAGAPSKSDSPSQPGSDEASPSRGSDGSDGASPSRGSDGSGGASPSRVVAKGSGGAAGARGATTKTSSKQSAPSSDHPSTKAPDAFLARKATGRGQVVYLWDAANFSRNGLGHCFARPWGSAKGRYGTLFALMHDVLGIAAGDRRFYGVL